MKRQSVLLFMLCACALGATACNPETPPVPAADGPHKDAGPGVTDDDDYYRDPVWQTPAEDIGEAVKTRRVSTGTVESLKDQGSASVIIQLRLPEEFRSEEQLSADEGKRQRAAIATAQQMLLANLIEKLGKPKISKIKYYQTIPYLALDIDMEALVVLVRMPLVYRVLADHYRYPSLSASVPKIGADLVHRTWPSYFPVVEPIDGRQTIAIIDTGVESTHPFLTSSLGPSKIVAEACFTSGDCANGTDSATGPGTGAPCTFGGCSHGTHVAGIAAGSTVGFRGVAPSANIIAIQVFHRETVDVPVEAAPCGSDQDVETREEDRPRTRDSDILRGLEHVFALRNNFSIAAVNMSLGGGAFTDVNACLDNSFSYRDMLANLRGAGVTIVAAAGNSAQQCNEDTGQTFFIAGIQGPACLPEVLSVGSTNTADQVSAYSQSADILDVLAPGENINSSIRNGGFDRFSGTSMAAPHVSGAVAVLKALQPWRSPNDIEGRLESTGIAIVDNRFSPPITKPRIQLNLAVESQMGTPLPPSGLSVAGLSGTSILVDWIDNSPNENEFRLTADPVSTGSLLIDKSTTVGANVTRGNVTRLRPNTEYELYARACFANGACSARSRSITQTTRNTVPSIPLNLRAGQITSISIEVLWDFNSSNPVDYFRLRSNANRGRNWISRTISDPASRNAGFANLVHASAYDFIIQACNSDGCSGDSRNLHVFTLGTDLPPAAPTNLRVCTMPSGPVTPGTPIQQLCYVDALTLLWNDNSDNEYTFEVEWSALSSPTGPVSGIWHTDTVLADREFYLFASLNAGQYRFRVRACNAIACSAYTNLLVHTVP